MSFNTLYNYSDNKDVLNIFTISIGTDRPEQTG